MFLPSPAESEREQLAAGLVVELDVRQVELVQRAHLGLAEGLEQDVPALALGADGEPEPGVRQVEALEDGVGGDERADHLARDAAEVALEARAGHVDALAPSPLA